MPSLPSSLLLCLCCALAIACEKPAQRPGRTVIQYWEKWTGFEGDAMRAIVDDFNASQDRIWVECMTVSQIDRKLMLATAGGVPPDVAGIWSTQLAVYAENNALLPLDRLAAAHGIVRDDYIPVFWEACSHRGRLFGLPTTPATNALIYNKRLFREAGLDPEKPPRSIAELEAFNEKLLRRRPDGSIESIGHLPLEPGWWGALWVHWFGGSVLADPNTLAYTSPESMTAYRWVQSYPERFGPGHLLTLRDGFGNFASPQNAFFTGRVAMVLQGVWMYNYIQNYAPPGFEWGVAPFPTVDPEHMAPVAAAECDIVVIPKGARHPREAFEFIRYVNSQVPMEKLCMAQRKFPPFRRVSEAFFRDHPNPFIRQFYDLASSPGVFSVPKIPNWVECTGEVANALTRIWSGDATAEEAIALVQTRQQASLDKRVRRWERIAPLLNAEWDREP